MNSTRSKPVDVRQLVVPIVLVCSLLGAAILGTWQFSRFSGHLDEVTIRLELIADRAGENATAIRHVVELLRSDYDVRLTGLTVSVADLSTRINQHLSTHPDTRLRDTLDEVEAELEQHLRRHP